MTLDLDRLKQLLILRIDKNVSVCGIAAMRQGIHTSSGVQPLRSIAGLSSSYHRFAHSADPWDERADGMKSEGRALTATIPGPDTAGDGGPLRAELFNGAKEPLVLIRTP